MKGLSLGEVCGFSGLGSRAELCRGLGCRGLFYQGDIHSVNFGCWRRDSSQRRSATERGSCRMPAMKRA